MDKHIIWSNHNLDFAAWKPDLLEQYPSKSDVQLLEIMHEQNNDYLNDERTNLNIVIPREILIIADVGRWNGRFSGFKVIDSGNIKDCLYSECDYSEWFVDKDGDFRCDAYHHDGTNHYLYRTFKPNTTESQIEMLKEKIYSGTATKADIERVTERLGDKIARVYGWEIIKPKQRNYSR